MDQAINGVRTTIAGFVRRRNRSLTVDEWRCPLKRPSIKPPTSASREVRTASSRRPGFARSISPRIFLDRQFSIIAVILTAHSSIDRGASQAGHGLTAYSKLGASGLDENKAYDPPAAWRHAHHQQSDGQISTSRTFLCHRRKRNHQKQENKVHPTRSIFLYFVNFTLSLFLHTMQYVPYSNIKHVLDKPTKGKVRHRSNDLSSFSET